MSDYKPTEYIVDFGDYRSNRFVELNMSLIEQNGAKLGERIVRCRDCEHRVHYWHHDCERWQCAHEMLEGLDVSPGFFCAWGERRNEDATR